MKFNLISKNNMGIVITLILVVLLSQSRFFDFLTENALGRMIILGMIIFISYTNQILGLLAVLFIIIAFNQYNMNVVQSYTYYEGFDISGNHLDASGNNIVTAKENVLNKKLTAVNNAAQKISANKPASTTTTTSESFGGREGFCMTDREINILRGKQSNTIPVFNNTRNQDDNVSPSDKSLFSSSYASF